MIEEPTTETEESLDSGSVRIGFYKCRPAKRVGGWLAWATLIPMTSADSVSEPADPLWFCFKPTEEDAIASIKAEVERECGIDEWQRQQA